jgi:hypothetical protein
MAGASKSIRKEAEEPVMGCHEEWIPNGGGNLLQLWKAKEKG